MGKGGTIVAKKWDPGKVEARVGKLPKIRKVETD